MRRSASFHLFAALGLLAILATSCGDASKKVFQPGNVVTGYTFNETPNTIQSNGYVYGVNKKTKDKLYLTSIPMTSTEGSVTVANRTSSTTTSFESLLKWLGKSNPRLDAGGGLKLSSEIRMELEFGDAKMMEVPVLDATRAIEAAVTRINQDLHTVAKVEDYDYYVIVSTIAARKLTYTFSKDVSNDANFNLNLSAIAETDPHLKIEKGETTTIRFAGDEYRNVLYKPLHLLVNSSLTGDYVIKVDPVQ